MSALPPLTEQTAAPGTKLNGYDRVITRDNVETFVSLTGESVDSYLVEGELTVPAGVLLGLYGPLSHGTFHYEAGVHVSSEMELGRVPRVDESIRVEGQVLDLYEKNGNKYVTFSVEVSTVEGERLATVAHTSIYALRKKSA
jgi:hypothetical protein